MQTSLTIAMFGHKHILSREGGIEVVVKELATRMAKKGNTVLCYDRSTKHEIGEELKSQNEYKEIKIIPVWTIDKKGLAAVTSSIVAAWKASFSRADVVHIHAEGPAAMCWLPKIRKKKVIVTIHGLDWQRAKWGCFASKYIKFGEKQAAKRADEIIVLSRGVQEYFKKTYNRNTVFIPNGVNKPNIRDANEIKKKWNLEKDSYVLFVGRIVPEKGIKYLIEAWKKVNSDKKLVIVGGSSDTQGYLSEIKQISKECESILFTGFQQGRILEELYSNSYLYVLPSDLEGMPLSLLEAMSYGNCCIVSDIPECTEVVEDKAIVFSRGNIEELRIIIQELLSDRNCVYEYKKNAAKYICEKYNWDDVVKKTLEIYETA